jgi:hypothetical protein
MKTVGLLVMLLSGLLLSGCADGFWRDAPEPVKEPVVCPSTDAGQILACLLERQKLSRKEFKSAYKAVSAQSATGEAAATLQLICLSLHEYASYKQFKTGMDTLAGYLKNHPEDAAALQGLQVLLLRIEREKTIKKVQGEKILDEKEELGAENKELLERNETLEKGALQDQGKIRELQKQIEELKNIETIIKNRER